MQRKRLTLKQEGFVQDLLETKNGAEAVRKNYNVTDDNTAAVIASENIRKPNIQERIRELRSQFVDDSFTVYSKQKELAEKTSNEELKNKIYNKVLDRAGFTPIHKQETRGIQAHFIIKRGDEQGAGVVDN